MKDFGKGDIVLVRYAHELDEFSQGDAAAAGYGLRAAFDLEGLGTVVNPEPLEDGQVQFGVRLDRDADLVDLIRALPTGSFTKEFMRFIDPNDSWEDHRTIDGDEEWQRYDVEFSFVAFERDLSA